MLAYKRLPNIFLALLLPLVLMAMGGCTTVTLPAPKPAATLPPVKLGATLPTTQPSSTPNVEYILTPTAAPELTATITPEASSGTATETIQSIPPTATWSVPVESGQAVVPILLYYHVSDDPALKANTITIENFRSQMAWLKDHGYTTITVSDLANALKNGGNLPLHPVVITFDQGNLDVYTNAMPIMQANGQIGVMYVVTNWLKASGFVHFEQIRTLIDNGWEIGDNSATYPGDEADMTDMKSEMYFSRLDFSTLLAHDVNTFAFPFYHPTTMLIKKAEAYNYLAAVCVSSSNVQTKASLFCLNRQRITNGLSLDQFATLVTSTQ